MDEFVTTYRKDFLWPYVRTYPIKTERRSFRPTYEPDCVCGSELSGFPPPREYVGPLEGENLHWSRLGPMAPLLDPKVYPAKVGPPPEFEIMHYDQPNTYFKKLQEKHPYLYNVLQTPPPDELIRRVTEDRLRTTYQVDYGHMDYAPSTEYEKLFMQAEVPCCMRPVCEKDPAPRVLDCRSGIRPPGCEAPVDPRGQRVHLLTIEARRVPDNGDEIPGYRDYDPDDRYREMPGERSRDYPGEDRYRAEMPERPEDSARRAPRENDQRREVQDRENGRDRDKTASVSKPRETDAKRPNGDRKMPPDQSQGQRRQPDQDQGQRRPPDQAQAQTRPPGQSQDQRRPPDQAQGQTRPPEQSQGQRRPPNQAQGQTRPPEQSQGQRRPPEQSQGQRAPDARTQEAARPPATQEPGRHEGGGGGFLTKKPTDDSGGKGTGASKKVQQMLAEEEAAKKPLPPWKSEYQEVIGETGLDIIKDKMHQHGARSSGRSFIERIIMKCR